MQDEICIAFSRNKEALYRVQRQLLVANIHSFVENGYQMLPGQDDRYYLKCHIDEVQAVREFIWAREENGELDIAEEDISWDDLLKEAQILNQTHEKSNIRDVLLVGLAILAGLIFLGLVL